jgi:4a-hydroxytetrahydrobiopterin dehydratase
MLSRKKLTEEEIKGRLDQIPGWGYLDGRLRSQFMTGNFNEGLKFVNQIGAIADKLDHHPDVLLTYPKVTIDLFTHDAGGVTEYDFELARQISGLLE